MAVSITLLQKACSGQVGNVQLNPLVDRLDSEFKDVFEENIARLVREALEAGNEDIFRIFDAEMDPRFFDESEYSSLKKLYAAERFSDYFHGLLLHAFHNLDQIPSFVGTRLREQTLCMLPSKYRWAVAFEGNRLGNEQCGLDFAGRPKQRGGDDLEYVEALRIYLESAGTYRPAMWNVAHYIDKGWISSPSDRDYAMRTLKIESRLSAKAQEQLAWFEPGDVDDPKATTFCFRVFYYMALDDQTPPFAKAATSLANMLESGRMIVKPDAPTTLEEQLQKIYQICVQNSDLFGTFNYAIHEAKRLLLGDEQFSDFELCRVKRLLGIGMECQHEGSIYYYALLSHQLYGRGKSDLSLEQIRQLYLSILRMENNSYQGRAALQLALLETDVDKKKKYLSIALDNNENEAAYRLAMMVYEDFLQGREEPLGIIRAINMLETRICLFRDDMAHDAKILLNGLKKINGGHYFLTASESRGKL